MTSDTYRAGDEDFEFIRTRFYDMAARHLSREESAEPEVKKSAKAKAPPVPSEIDGRPVEVERYGDGRRDIRRNNAADAMQWLIMKGHLNSRIDGPRTDRAVELAWAEGRARITTATGLAAIFEKAELTPLRSPDFEATPGGSFGPRHVSLTKLACMKTVRTLRCDIPPACMALLDAIVVRNEFPWHGKSKREEQLVFDGVRMALDFAAWSLSKHRSKPDMTEEEMARRWPESAQWFTARKLTEATLAFKMDQTP